MRRASPSVPAAVAAALTVAFAARSATGMGGDALRDRFDGLVHPAIFVLCAASLLLRARRRDGEAPAWLLAAGALLAWEAGDIVLRAGGGVLPVPSVADVLWLALYPLLAASLVLLLRRRIGDVPRTLWLDGLIGGLGAAALASAILLPTALDRSGDVSAAELATNVAYPIGDLLLLGTVVGVVGASGWRFGRSWALLAAAFTTFAITDTLYLEASASDSYASGGAIDVGWFVAAVLLSVAAAVPTPALRPALSRGRRLLVIPGTIGVAVLAMLAYGALDRVSAPSVALAALASCAVITRMTCTFMDMERASRALEHARREAERRSRSDPLTGLANRRAFSERLRAELDRGLRDGRAPGLLLLDVDRFKRVNDRHGHSAGDLVLIEVARRLAATVRGYDTVARWGGEEFALVVAEAGDEDRLLGVAERLRGVIEATPVLLEDGTELTVTASFGGAIATPTCWSPEALALDADLALYTSKRTGRNRCCIAGPSIGAVQEEDDAFRVARSLALAGALREGTTPMHCEQVGDLAGETAAELGLPVAEVRRCRLGGMLHDVGKVAMPDAILAKRGPLDDEEWEVMRTHPVAGEQIIGHVEGLDEAAAAVRHHHERWDGRGYPDALAGEAIPVSARVVAAADAYSAITDDRVYRRGRDMDEAIVELERSAGTHLDPQVVAALVRVLRRRRELAHARLLAHRQAMAGASEAGEGAEDDEAAA